MNSCLFCEVLYVVFKSLLNLVFLEHWFILFNFYTYILSHIFYVHLFLYVDFLYNHNGITTSWFVFTLT